MNLNEIKEKLKDRKLSVVAEKTGLHYNTVYRIANGYTKSPSFDAVSRIAEYLKNGD